MIRAITSFKPNSTNVNSSNKHYGNSQPSFKNAEQEYVDAFNRALGKYTEPAAIEMTFLDFVGEIAMSGRETANSFVTKFRNKVPGVTEEKIEKAIQEGIDFKHEQNYKTYCRGYTVG